MQTKNSSSFLLIGLVFILCFSTIAVADRTYLTLVGLPSYEKVFYGNVGVKGGEMAIAGNIYGDMNGTGAGNVCWLTVTSGSYYDREFDIGNFTAVTATNEYVTYLIGMASGENDYNYGAIFGDIGALRYQNSLELTSILGIQRSGNFYWIETGRTEIDTFSSTIPLTIYSGTATANLSGYHSGTIIISGLAFDFDVSSLGPFSNWDIDELVGFIGTYDWSETDVENDGEIYAIYTESICLGAITGGLKGVLVPNLENYTAFIEHAGTAPPIPIPSTLLLFGSGLIGVLAIKRRNSG